MPDLMFYMSPQKPFNVLQLYFHKMKFLIYFARLPSHVIEALGI